MNAHMKDRDRRSMLQACRNEEVLMLVDDEQRQYLDIVFALQKLREQEASTSHQYKHGHADAEESV